MPKDTPLSAEKEVDIFELYNEDPELADELVFGRVPHKDRRGFLKGAGLATMGALIGATIPFHRKNLRAESGVLRDLFCPPPFA